MRSAICDGGDCAHPGAVRVYALQGASSSSTSPLITFSNSSKNIFDSFFAVLVISPRQAAAIPFTGQAEGVQCLAGVEGHPPTELCLDRPDLQRDLGHQIIFTVSLKLFTARDTELQHGYIIQHLVDLVARGRDGDFILQFHGWSLRWG